MTIIQGLPFPEGELMEQNPECSCACCQDGLVGCLCIHHAEPEQCDCAYCAAMIKAAL